MTDTKPRSTWWAEAFHDAVVVWLRPYADVYRRYGHDLDDAAQEGRFALLQQQQYLDSIHATAQWGDQQVASAAKTLVRRAARRHLLGRSTRRPKTTEQLLVDAAADHREQEQFMRLEITEMIEEADRTGYKEEAQYIREMMDAGKSLRMEGRKAAAEFVLQYLERYR